MVFAFAARLPVQPSGVQGSHPVSAVAGDIERAQSLVDAADGVIPTESLQDLAEDDVGERHAGVGVESRNSSATCGSSPRPAKKSTQTVVSTTISDVGRHGTRRDRRSSQPCRPARGPAVGPCGGRVRAGWLDRCFLGRCAGDRPCVSEELLVNVDVRRCWTHSWTQLCDRWVRRWSSTAWARALAAFLNTGPATWVWIPLVVDARGCTGRGSISNAGRRRSR